MPGKPPALDDRLAPLRASTPARVFLPSAGAAVATDANLAFQLAHAQARDAVEDRLDADALAQRLRARGLETICVESAASSGRVYLMRPDLGRRLDESAPPRLAAFSGAYDLVFVIADGLSARAIAAHAAPLLDAALPAFQSDGWRIGPVVVVQRGRVAIGDEIGDILGAKLVAVLIGDEIGAILGAKLVAVLIGERPGLSSPDSLGVYLTFAPRVGRSDAERNCLSNIRQQGMSYAEAAARLFYLAAEARRRKISGVELKDEFPAATARSLGVKEAGALPTEGQ